MKGIKPVAALLANRINQFHYVESILRKVFQAGADSSGVKFIHCKDEFPALGEVVLVKSVQGEIRHAVYSSHDEFDVLIPRSLSGYRKHWYKFSSDSYPYWARIAH